MSPGSFKQDGLSWRINLIKQRFSEWSEYQAAQFDAGSWHWGFLKSELLWQMIKFCLWSLIALILVWMTWQLYLLFRTYGKGWPRVSDRHFSSSTPLNVPQLSAADWVERSQSARIEGNYRISIFCLYQAMLQLLDERNILPHQLSLTDEEYRRTLSQIQVSSLAAYELLLSIHQRLCFSKAEANQALLEECRQAYQQIEN